MKFPNAPRFAVFSALTIVFCTSTSGFAAHADSPAKAPSVPTIRQIDEALIDSAAQGRLDQVKLEVYQGANVNCVDPFKRTPLTACTGGEGPETTRLQIIEMLVGLGADVNQHSVFQPTPLFIAIEYNQNKIAHYLLGSGADPHTFDSQGETALMEAARTGQLEMVKLLIAKGADVRATDHTGRTALMVAGGSPVDAANWIDSADDVTPNEGGYTTIRWIARRNDYFSGGDQVAQSLIDAGSDINALDNDDNTALILAAGAGKTDIVKTLIAAHADWKHRNDISDNALMAAAKGAHEDTVAYLESVCGTRDPVYKALKSRLASQNSTQVAAISRVLRAPAAQAITDHPGLVLRLSVDNERYESGEPVNYRYTVQNNSEMAVSLVRPAVGLAHTSTVTWTLKRIDTKQWPPEIIHVSGAGCDSIDDSQAPVMLTLPPHTSLDIGAAFIPYPASAPDIALLPSGVYRASVEYINDPRAIVTSDPDARIAAEQTLPCRLVSNEITIVKE